MNQLITSNQPLTMRSFDLWVKLNDFRTEEGGNKIQHGDFLDRVEDECDDLGVSDFFPHPQNKQPVRFYNLNKDQMLLVGMRESKIVRKKVLMWIKQIAEPKVPTNFAEALQLAADQARQLELAAPKVEFHDKIVNDAATFSIRDAAKKIQQRPNKFTQWLRTEGYLCQNNMPKQQYVNQGLFKTHTGQSKEEYQFSQTRVTSKGLAYFTKKLGDTQL